MTAKMKREVWKVKLKVFMMRYSELSRVNLLHLSFPQKLKDFKTENTRLNQEIEKMKAEQHQQVIDTFITSPISFITFSPSVFVNHLVMALFDSLQLLLN